MSYSVARQWYAFLVLGSASFTLFGSLVPFQFERKTGSEAVAAFVAGMTNRLEVESKSDGIANVMLGIPLGFGLLGFLCVDRRVPAWRASLYGLALLPATCAFAASVEFAQVFVPVRTCSGADVLAQTLGSALGMAAWLIIGQRLTQEIRQATTGGGAAARFLIGYLLLLGFIQALPFDLTLSPASAYRKFRDGGVRVIPFGEFRGLGHDESWERVSGLLKLAGLYLPAGLLAGRLPGKFWLSRNPARAALAAFGLSVSIEAGQVLVASRVSSATDALVGGLAALVGWRLTSRGHLSQKSLWGLGVLWFLVLATISWQPFTFPGPAQPFDWIPGKALEGGNPLSALEEMLTKLVLFGVVGALVSACSNPVATLAKAAAAGLAVSALFEAVQTQTPNHTPSITDVLLGGMGALAGAWTTGRLVLKQHAEDRDYRGE